MGFKGFKIMNKAFLAKQAQRLADNPNSLWVQVIKGKYFPEGNLWKAKNKNGCSWAWENILEGRDLLLTHDFWQIGDGKTTQIFKDKWVEKEHALQSQTIQDKEATVNTLLNQQLRSWDVHKILNAFPRNQAVKIITIPLLPMGEQDKLIWPYSKNGAYEVKSGYHVENNRRMKVEYNNCSTCTVVDNNFWNQLQNAKVEPKIKTFVWKACKNALPTRHNFSIRKLTSITKCPMMQTKISNTYSSSAGGLAPSGLAPYYNGIHHPEHHKIRFMAPRQVPNTISKS